MKPAIWKLKSHVNSLDLILVTVCNFSKEMERDQFQIKGETKDLCIIPYFRNLHNLCIFEEISAQIGSSAYLLFHFSLIFLNIYRRKNIGGSSWHLFHSPTLCTTPYFLWNLQMKQQLLGIFSVRFFLFPIFL